MDEEEKPKEVRERWWSEIDLNAKIERLRKELKRAQRTVRDNERIIRKLLRHVHGEKGELLIPFSYLDGEGESYGMRGANPDDTYF